MNDRVQLEGPSPLPPLAKMGLGDIWAALGAGWRDFRQKPMMGLFFAHIYVVGGWLIYGSLSILDMGWLAIPITVGFSLIGPFLAVGLYEVSRRLEAGDRDFRRNDIFSVIWRQRLRQLPSMAWVIIVYFLFWSFFAHMLFALFIGPSALMNVTSSYAYLLQPEGLIMLLVGSGFGAVFALVLFCLTVVSLPLLLDKEVDFDHRHAQKHCGGQSQPEGDADLGGADRKPDLFGDAACAVGVVFGLARFGSCLMAYLSPRLCA